MQYKIILWITLIFSSIFSIYACGYLNVESNHLIWFIYSIWALALAGFIGYLICLKYTHSWRRIFSIITQLLLTLLFYLILLAFIPSTFTITMRNLNNAGSGFSFRPISHWLYSPTISVTILNRDVWYSQTVQKVYFFGYWGYTTYPKWLEEKYIFDPEKEPSTLEYAFKVNDKNDFIHKFEAILDTNHFMQESNQLKSLTGKIDYFNKNNQDNAIEALINWQALDTLDTITEANTDEQRWLDRAKFINFNDEQLYQYYRLAKNKNKIRFIRDKLFHDYYATDYFEQAINHCDIDLINDLIANNNTLRAIYVVLAFDRVKNLETDSDEYPACLNMAKKIATIEPFTILQTKISGKNSFNYTNRNLADIGYAMSYNGSNISFLYNGILMGLKDESPELYSYLRQNGYEEMPNY